jgi:serine/threonine protein kinase
MFVQKEHWKPIDLKTCGISLHGGVPKQFYTIREKQFGDWEIPPWELFIYQDKILGEGSFSKVYLAKWRETLVVAKVIDETICQEKKELVLREFNTMTKLHHPNIVQFLGYIDNPFIIVMEYIPKGNLLTNIPKISKTQKINIMKDVLKGLVYIHNRKPYSLIHRDIKPTNILLTNSKVAKITDFGLSKFYSIEKNYSYENLSELDNEANSELTTPIGTERYMAPETKSNNYNNKIDIYSCGIMLYEMFENKRYIPYTNMQWFWTPKKIKKIIINNMLSKNPDDRPEALTILRLLEI